MDWILFGVPQGSILGPILFNIIHDIFMFTEEFNVANYADDSTAYEYKATLNKVITSLERDSICLVVSKSLLKTQSRQAPLAFEWSRGKVGFNGSFRNY